MFYVLSIIEAIASITVVKGLMSITSDKQLLAVRSPKKQLYPGIQITFTDSLLTISSSRENYLKCIM